MWGVTTQVSEPKIKTVCTTDLKKNPDTHGFALSLLRILVILFHSDLTHDKLLTTSGQLSSAD